MTIPATISRSINRVATVVLAAFILLAPTAASAATDPTYDCGSYGGGAYSSCDTTSSSANSSTSTGSNTTSTPDGTSETQTSDNTPPSASTSTTNQTEKTHLTEAVNNNRSLFFGSLVIFLCGLALLVWLFVKKRKQTSL